MPNRIFPSCPVSYSSASPRMSLVISMFSPVAEDSSKILLWTFFSTRLTWASPHTSHAPALTTLDSSVWHSPYCPREPTPGTALLMCPQVSRRGTSPSSLPAGCACAGTVQQERPALNATRTHWWHTLSKSFHAVSPQPVLLHSCHIPGAGSEPHNALLQTPWTRGPVSHFISHCPPSQLPAQTCWGCTGALQLWRIPLRNNKPTKV